MSENSAELEALRSSILEDLNDFQEMTKKLKQEQEENKKKRNYFLFNRELNQEDLDSILYTESNNITVVFDYDNYEDIFRNIQLLTKTRNNITFKIKVKDKNRLNDFLFSNLDKIVLSNIMICNSKHIDEDMEISKYIEYERILLSMITPAQELTPLERYLYAYNIVKNYKKYNKSESWGESRTLYNVLDGKYMVCAGYVRLLEDLLEKLNIESCCFSVTVNGLVDENPNHDILQVNIKDSKYGIDGIYFCDPTNDQAIDENKDYYTFCLMPLDSISYFTTNVSNINDFFAVKSIDEFLEKCKEWENLPQNKNLSKLVYELLNYIRNFDVRFYSSMCQKYPLIIKDYCEVDGMISQQILAEIGNYFLRRNNNKVDKNSFYSAVKVIYQKYYGFKNVDTLDREFANVIAYNDAYIQEFYSQSEGDKKI